MAVLLETSRGDIVIDLFVDECPVACKNFLKLCKYAKPHTALRPAHRLPSIPEPPAQTSTQRRRQCCHSAQQVNTVSSPLPAAQDQVLQQLHLSQCAAQLHRTDRRPDRHWEGRHVDLWVGAPLQAVSQLLSRSYSPCRLASTTATSGLGHSKRGRARAATPHAVRSRSNRVQPAQSRVLAIS